MSDIQMAFMANIQDLIYDKAIICSLKSLGVHTFDSLMIDLKADIGDGLMSPFGIPWHQPLDTDKEL